MNRIDWTYLTALFSISFGWLLNELGQWFRTMKEDKRIKKQILYNLLETNFIFNQLDISDILNLTIDRIMLRFPENEQTEEVKQQLIEQSSELIKGLVQKSVIDNLKDMEVKYQNAVDSLSTIDPITAYRLKGKTKILQTFEIFQDYYIDVKTKFPDDSELIQNSFDTTIKSIEPDIIRGAISDIEVEIKDIAFSIDIITWFKVKSSLKSSKDRIRNEGVAKVDKLLDILIPKQSQLK